MSATGLTAVLVMIGAVMLAICYWKQIAILLLLLTVAVFCFGIYYIISIIDLYAP
jgi:hypothetical protein